jgi:arylsulfatase A-like enzyme
MKVLILTALLLMPLATLHAADAALKPNEKPNVLIILVDDMGYGDPHCFNPDSKIATPHIDRLASEGMRFTDAHAGGSICVPSRYSLLSGRMPYRNWSAQNATVQKRNKREMLHFQQPRSNTSQDV